MQDQEKGVDAAVMQPMGGLHLFQNADVIYAARGLEHCWQLFVEDMGFDKEDEADERRTNPFEQIPDDKLLEVGSEDPTGAADEVDRNGYWFRTKRAVEWPEQAGHFSGE